MLFFFPSIWNTAHTWFQFDLFFLHLWKVKEKITSWSVSQRISLLTWQVENSGEAPVISTSWACLTLIQSKQCFRNLVNYSTRTEFEWTTTYVICLRWMEYHLFIWMESWTLLVWKFYQLWSGHHSESKLSDWKEELVGFVMRHTSQYLPSIYSVIRLKAYYSESALNSVVMTVKYVRVRYAPGTSQGV